MKKTMTLLEQYLEGFKNIRTEVINHKDRIELVTWHERLLSPEIVKSSLWFNLDGSEFRNSDYTEVIL